MWLEFLAVDVFFKQLFHIFDNSSELQSKNLSEQSSSHIESFLSVVITIIFNSSTQSRLDEPIGHISSEVSLLELITIRDTNMREHVVSEYASCPVDPLGSRDIGSQWATQLGDVLQALLLGGVVQGIFEGGSEGFGHCCIRRITQNHIDNLLILLNSKGSKQDYDWDLLADLWDCGSDFAASFRLFNIELELECWFVAFFILGADLGVP